MLFQRLRSHYPCFRQRFLQGLADDRGEMGADSIFVFSGAKKAEPQRRELWQTIGEWIENPYGRRPAERCAKCDAKACGCRSPQPAEARADECNAPGDTLLIKVVAGNAT